MSLILSGTDGLSDVDGSASTPAIRGTDTNTGIFFPAADTIAFSEGGAEVARFNSSGNFGVGTTSPSYKLDVNGISQVSGLRQSFQTDLYEVDGALSNYSSTNGVYLNGNANGWSQLSGDGTRSTFVRVWGSGASPANFIACNTAGSERMRITSGGAVCIGRTSQIFGSTGLCVETGSNSINAVVTNSGQSALSAVNTAVNTGTSCSLMSFNVGISGGGSQVGTVTYNGTLVQYNTTSDQRLKKNIVDAGSGLAKLANVKIRAFDWVEHNNHTDFGVVAQELVTVAPEAVSIGDTGKTIERIWGVDTSTLVPAMIKAIQEQQAIITDLKSRIEALEVKNDSI